MASQIRTPERGLTPKFIEALKPDPARRYEVADRRAPGLRLRVYPSGVKSFRWVCNSRGQVYTLGSWTLSETPGFVTLAQAREWLDKLKAGNASGSIDAVEAELKTFLRRRSRIADPAPEAPDRRTFAPVAEEFYRDDILRNRKRPDDARRILDADILPVLGARPLPEITTLDCRDVVKRTVDRGAPVHAGKVLATLKQLFGWAQTNGFTDKNPAAPLKGDRIGVQANVSDRCLDDPHKPHKGEIAAFWRALDVERGPATVERPDPRTGKTQSYAQRVPTLSPATATALRLLLLTGVRTGELLKARWENVDLDAATWTIPVSDQKLTKKQERRAKPFVVPLSATALQLFRDLRALAGESDWVMASGEASGGHFTDKALGRAMRRLQAGDSPALKLPGGEASPHDLRRTMRTHLGKLRVPLHIVERCLNHSLGRIVQTYDVGDYLDERREALDKWDAYVQRLLAPEQSNVAFLSAAAGSAA